MAFGQALLCIVEVIIGFEWNMYMLSSRMLVYQIIDVTSFEHVNTQQCLSLTSLKGLNTEQTDTYVHYFNDIKSIYIHASNNSNKQIFFDMDNILSPLVSWLLLKSNVSLTLPNMGIL